MASVLFPSAGMQAAALPTSHPGFKPNPGLLQGCSVLCRCRRLHTPYSSPLLSRADSDTLESCQALGKGQNLALKINEDFFHRLLQKRLWYLLHPITALELEHPALNRQRYSQNPISNWEIC